MNNTILDNTISNKEKYPYEIIELPSGGYFYSEDNPLSSGKIKMRQPTAKHEDILTSKNLITKGIVIDEFLKSLIIDPIDYDTMLLGDKNGIMIASRILLYGPEYKTQIKCPSCGNTQVETFNLAELETKEIDYSKFVRGVNEFDYILPYSKIPIKIKLLTNKDEREIYQQLKVNKKHNLNSVENEISIRLSYVITNWNGETSRSKIYKYVSEELLSRDSFALRDYLAEINPGINTDVYFECNNCGYSANISLPMDVNFFWPSRRLQE